MVQPNMGRILSTISTSSTCCTEHSSAGLIRRACSQRNGIKVDCIDAWRRSMDCILEALGKASELALYE
ncbi:hypothetical protein V6N11_059288 [Hibiscus sabdariffa]|uniref:Uncharacterized protein n=1 Tax=Hibiscus sabdariffa TaxID=183260 RepID=A0ABR2U707_9ROSI